MDLLSSFFFRWNYSARCSYSQLEYRTNLGFEGLPENAWEPETMKLIIADLKVVEIPTPPPALWRPDFDDEGEGESPSHPSSVDNKPCPHTVATEHARS